MAQKVRFTVKYLGDRFGENARTTNILCVDADEANQRAIKWVLNCGKKDGMDGEYCYYEIWRQSKTQSHFVLSDNIINHADY